MRTTSDFLVASRRVSPLLNSAAVSGEYLSAASFLGVAGLVVKDGIGSLWYPVGFTAGYIAMLVLVAAPMRRSGALTVPDFAEARLNSPALRRVTAVVILVIGGLYLVPQFRTAGLVLSAVTNTPVLGRRRHRRLRCRDHPRARRDAGRHLRPGVPVRPQAGPVHRPGDLVAHPGHARRPATTRCTPSSSRTFDQRHHHRVPDRHHARPRSEPLNGDEPATWEVPQGTTVTFPKGAAGPEVVGEARPGGDGWSRPLLDLANAGHPLLGTWALVVALALGHHGPAARDHALPHQPRRPRRPPHRRVHRRAARHLLPVPRHLRRARPRPRAAALPLRRHRHRRRRAARAGRRRLAGQRLHRAAHRRRVRRVPRHFAGAAARRVRRHLLRPAARRPPTASRSPWSWPRRSSFSLRCKRSASTPGVLVTWAFTVAASTFCPLLVLGIWWSRLTVAGAMSGVARRTASTSSGAIAGTLLGLPVTGLARHPGGPARALVGPAGVPHHDRRVAARPPAVLGADGHASPAPQRGSRTDARADRLARTPRTCSVLPDQPS